MIFSLSVAAAAKSHSPATGLGLIEKWSLLPVNSTSLQRESFSNRGHAGIRTQGPILKRDVLYRLSYVTSGNNISGFTQELSGIPILCPGFTGKGCKGRYFFENCKTGFDFLKQNVLRTASLPT